MTMKQTARSNTSLGCIGNRVYTGLGDDELYFTIPGPGLAAVVSKLETIVHANNELEAYHAGAPPDDRGATRLRRAGGHRPDLGRPRATQGMAGADSTMARIDDAGAARLVIQADHRLAEQLRGLAGRRMVFFAGLPGTGKSLLVHQLAHVAAGNGRSIHLLQWDVARPVFEASPAGRRYPLAAGVTHAVIRKAAGLWVRHALVGWNGRHPGAEHLLIGETPFVGNRFVELAHRLEDRAETLLAAPSCRFVVAVPSVEVRRFLEAERERRASSPLHPREREDAPPQVLRDLWGELAEVARRLGITAAGTSQGGGRDEPTSYDPVVYRTVYETVLRHRNVEAVSLDVILPTEKLSVYDFAVAPPDLVPTEAEAEEFIREVERRHPDPTALERGIARWWEAVSGPFT